MLKADAYINAAACVSPAKVIEGIGIPEDALMVNENSFLKCIDPVYKKYIDPMASRRMSRVVKMGLYAAKSCLEEVGIENPDAIITGTGLGCVEDTEKFIDNIFRNEEKLLNPTPFIQSTHNTIGSQIALLLKCHNYNVTYTQRGLTFESALLDSMLLLKEKKAENILLGGVDEITKISWQIMNRLGFWKKENVSRAGLIESNTNGSIAGEGAVFFSLSDKQNEKSFAKIIAINSINKKLDDNEVRSSLDAFLSDNKIEIDFALLGFNGDKRSDFIYHELINTSLKNISCGYFKHLCGEYHTASSFALWLASQILKIGDVPEVVRVKSTPSTANIRNILIYNHYRNINHSFIILQHV
jgi:3-oxoacyl-[acyl-carrier-protein] synthase II